MMETVAVYQEERVKVYGITHKINLALAVISFPADDCAHWGQRIIDFERLIERFELVTYHATEKDRTELHLLFDMENAAVLNKNMQESTEVRKNASFSLQLPVEILYLFGPHFQDRYGIADIAFNALLQSKTDILVSGCSGTSMYFVTRENQGLGGLKILSKTFLVPTTI